MLPGNIRYAVLPGNISYAVLPGSIYIPVCYIMLRCQGTSVILHFTVVRLSLLYHPTVLTVSCITHAALGSIGFALLSGKPTVTEQCCPSLCRKTFPVVEFGHTFKPSFEGREREDVTENERRRPY